MLTKPTLVKACQDLSEGNAKYFPIFHASETSHNHLFYLQTVYLFDFGSSFSFFIYLFLLLFEGGSSGD